MLSCIYSFEPVNTASSIHPDIFINKTMNETAQSPHYLFVANTLRDRISNGDYKANEKLPSENELATEFHTSRVTIRQALNELRRQNYIYTEDGRGSFVSPIQYKGSFENGGFSRQFQQMGYKANSIVLAYHRVPSIPENFLKHTDLSDFNSFSEGAYYLHRIRMADLTPICVQETYVPVKHFPRLDEIDFSTHSIYQELYNRYNAQPSISDMIILPIQAGSKEAEYLDIQVGDPIMESWSVVYMKNKNILECTHSLDTNRFAFHIRYSYESGFKFSE